MSCYSTCLLSLRAHLLLVIQGVCYLLYQSFLLCFQAFSLQFQFVLI